MFNPLKWLLTKYEPATKENTVSDITATDSTVVAPQDVADSTQVDTVQPTPVVEVKTGVKDFEAAFAFVEQGVAQLGEAAKDELKALAQKYL